MHAAHDHSDTVTKTKTFRPVNGGGGGDGSGACCATRCARDDASGGERAAASTALRRPARARTTRPTGTVLL